MGAMIMKFSTKICLFLLIGLLFFAFTSVAETKYVTEDLTITLRTGPAKDRKIIAFPKSGTPLEVVTPGDEYTEVKMSNGKQGWVLTRFLTGKVPAYIVLDGLQKKYDRTAEKYETLKKKSSSLASQNRDSSSELTETKKKLDKLTIEHETLRKESKEFLKLKAKYKKAVKESSKMRDKADKLGKEVEQLSDSSLYTGLLYGGGLVALGFIVGFIVKKPKRRSQLL